MADTILVVGATGMQGGGVADKETDIWATSPINSISLHFDGTSWVKCPWPERAG
jgi:hypothetical protein